MEQTLKFVQVSPECLETMITNAVSKGMERLKDSFSKPAMSENYLTRDEVAKKLKISKGTLNNWTKEEKIPSHKINRRVLFKESEVEKFINEKGNTNEKD